MTAFLRPAIMAALFAVGPLWQPTEAADAAKRARDMGLHVVVSDIDVNAPGFALAHDRLIANVYGAEETADAEDSDDLLRD